MIRLQFTVAPILALTATLAAAPNPAFPLPEEVDALLDIHCYGCHDADYQKGDIRLDTLADLETGKRLDLLNRMQEQLHFHQMPPKKKDQPTETERAELLAFLSQELGKHQASTLEEKLLKPEFGNYVDHQKLFSGEFADLPGFTYDRRWLISEYIFNAKFQRIFLHDPKARFGRKRVSVLGASDLPGLSLTNPFLLPEVSGVRYYANEDFTGGHLSSMLTNAQNSAARLTEMALGDRHRDFLPAIKELMALENEQNIILAARREFLETSIATFCEELYGSRNAELLPPFQPVTLKPLDTPAEGKPLKKLPLPVATKSLDAMGGSEVLHRILLNPEHSGKSDSEIKTLCEKTWFYHGDHELKIQGRMAILRDYLPEIREDLKTNTKIKARPYKPLPEEEMAALATAIRTQRQNGDFYSEVMEKCLAAWEETFARARLAAGPPSDELLAKLVGELSLKILEREPTPTEASEYLAISRTYVEKLGKLKAIQKLIQTFFLSSEFVYRQEFGAGARTGTAVKCFFLAMPAMPFPTPSPIRAPMTPLPLPPPPASSGPAPITSGRSAASSKTGTPIR